MTEPETVPIETAIATTRADIARADTKAQIASAAILAIALAVAPKLSGLSSVGVVAASITGLAGLAGLLSAGAVLWPRTGAPVGTTLLPLDTELKAVRRIAATKFTAIRCAYTATAITITAAITALAL